MRKVVDTCPRFVITLVHGTTWFRDAGWTQPDSSFRRTLQASLPGARIERFQWSGKNSARARVRAAEELRVRLREHINRYSGARHYVIGHSHGGNVALYALQDEGIASKMSGVIALSTPFLWATLRDVGPINWKHIKTQFIVFLAAIIGLMAGLAIGLSIYRLTHYYVIEGSQLVSSAFFMFCFLVSWVTWKIFGIFWDVHLARVKKLLISLEYPHIPNSKLLIIRSSADEASLGLALAQIMNELMSRLWILGDFGSCRIPAILSAMAKGTHGNGVGARRSSNCSPSDTRS